MVGNNRIFFQRITCPTILRQTSNSFVHSGSGVRNERRVKTDGNFPPDSPPYLLSPILIKLKNM